MSCLQILGDIAINVFSDFIFVSLLVLLLWVLRGKELAEAKRFFGFDRQTRIGIRVSGHEDKETRTKGVVTALEYEAAVEIKNALQQLSGRGLIRELRTFIAGLIGQDPKLPGPAIEVSPLIEVKEPPRLDSLILIGGPVRNQLTKFYMQANPLLKYDPERGKYQGRVGKQYQDIDEFGNVAILVKMILKEQVVIIAFGTGEQHTKSAVQYLISNWKELNKKYPNRAVGVLLSVDNEGNTTVQKMVSE